MKNKSLLILYILFGFLSFFKAQAQNSKIGYVDSKYILSLMPAVKQAQNDLFNFEQQIKKELNAKQKELQKKHEDFYQSKDTVNIEIRKSALDKESQAFYAIMESRGQDIEKKKGNLLTPLETKIRNTIKEIALEKGYTDIVELNTALYYNEASNITVLVLKKLGLEAK